MDYESFVADVMGFDKFDYRSSFSADSTDVMFESIDEGFLGIMNRCRVNYIAPCPPQQYFAERHKPDKTEGELVEVPYYLQADPFHLWQCLRAQPRGEEGFLQLNGPNHFYIRGAWWEAVQRVTATWIKNRGWKIETHAIQSDFKIGQPALIIKGHTLPASWAKNRTSR
jgi:hypothetical protein